MIKFLENSKASRPLLFLFLFVWLLGCGVKGKPLQPKNPPWIGHGEMIFSQQNKNSDSSATTTTLPPRKTSD